VAQNGGRDMGGCWGGVDGARQWPKAARRWSVLGTEVDGGRQSGKNAARAVERIWERRGEEVGLWFGAQARGDKDAWSGTRGRPWQSSGHRRVAKQLVCMREASGWAPFKRCLRLTSGPLHFFDSSRFSNTHTLIFELVTFLMPKFCRSTDWNTRSNSTFCIKFQIPKDCKL
jgi:hypothetical protein